jgi:hypothetical protein
MILFETNLFSYWVWFQIKINKRQFKDKCYMFIVTIKLFADKSFRNEEKLRYDLLLIKRLRGL